MSFFPTPPAADPLHIFHPDGPIEPAFMRRLLDATLATQPLAADAPPDRQADRRLASMHALGAFQPGDALEAMLAGQIVAANARVMRCYELAAAPGADEADARRHGAQAAALTRCMLATLRSVQGLQAMRRKDAEHPSERTGYWFRDVSVPSPEDAAPLDEHARAPEPVPAPPGGAAAPAAAADEPVSPPTRLAPAASAPRERPGQGDTSRTPSNATRQPAPARQQGAGRQHPMPSGDPDPPDRCMTGDALMRFASRRLSPNQSVEVAWAQAVTEAAAEAAEAACP